MNHKVIYMNHKLDLKLILSELVDELSHLTQSPRLKVISTACVCIGVARHC